MSTVITATSKGTEGTKSRPTEGREAVVEDVTVDPVVARWRRAAPEHVGKIDVFGEDEVQAIWAQLYKIVPGTNTEEQQDAVRSGFYHYSHKNGTTEKMEYTKHVKMGDGRLFHGYYILQVLRKTQVRRFLRGCMKESYEALKFGGKVEKDPEIIAKAEELGIAPENAFAMADWFTGCSLLTPVEQEAHRRAKAAGIRRAALARGGRSEEDEMRARIAERNEAGVVNGAVRRFDSGVDEF